MYVYQDSIETFQKHVLNNEIADLMSEKYHELWGTVPGTAEIGSWQNSLSKLKDLIELAGIKDCHILLEYKVPSGTSRIDCLLFGKDALGHRRVVLLEMKQWQQVGVLYDKGKNQKAYYIETIIHRHRRKVVHPSFQVKRYTQNMTSTIAAFEQEKLQLHGFVYCHNYKRVNETDLFDPFYNEVLTSYPVYGRNDTLVLADQLHTLLSSGEGKQVFELFVSSNILLAKDFLGDNRFTIAGRKNFSILNEEMGSLKLIWSKIAKAQKTKQKTVIIVKDEQGTGVQHIGELLMNRYAQKHKGKKRLDVFKYKSVYNDVNEGFNVYYKAIIAFSLDTTLLTASLSPNELDLLILTKPPFKDLLGRWRNLHSEWPLKRLVKKHIRLAKVAVVFIMGHTDWELSNAVSILGKKGEFEVLKVNLTTQFRIDYLKWLNALFDSNVPKKMFRLLHEYDLRIFDSLNEMYQELQKFHVCQQAYTPRVRMLAGPYWTPERDKCNRIKKGEGVQVGDFFIPWISGGDDELTKNWISSPEGFGYIGDARASFGYEFNYIGLIIGDDIIFNKALGSLQGNKEYTGNSYYKKSEDGNQGILNCYNTMMGRGLKGCFLYFINKDTERFFKRWIAS